MPVNLVGINEDVCEAARTLIPGAVGLQAVVAQFERLTLAVKIFPKLGLFPSVVTEYRCFGGDGANSFRRRTGLVRAVTQGKRGKDVGLFIETALLLISADGAPLRKEFAEHVP